MNAFFILICKIKNHFTKQYQIDPYKMLPIDLIELDLFYFDTYDISGFVIEAITYLMLQFKFLIYNFSQNGQCLSFN